MTVIDPNTGLTITCQPWEYSELCKQRGWIKTVYTTSATPVQKRGFTPPEEKAELEWAKKAERGEQTKEKRTSRSDVEQAWDVIMSAGL